MHDILADDFEDRARGLECRWSATDHHGQRAVGGTRNAAAHWCIEQRHTLRREFRRRAHDHLRARRRCIDNGLRARPINDAAGARQHGFDNIRLRQAEHDDIAAARNVRRALCSFRAFLDERGDGGFTDVMNDKCVARREEARRHARSHDAQSDEADVRHVCALDPMSFPTSNLAQWPDFANGRACRPQMRTGASAIAVGGVGTVVAGAAFRR